jgi:type II secretory pathway predicted ATPase ExeA
MGDILQEIHELLRERPDIPAHILGSYTRCSASSVRHVLSGAKPMGPTVARELQRVVCLVKRGEILRPAQDENSVDGRRARSFYLTESCRKIGQVLTFCAENAKIGVISGEYGIGKSEGVQFWRTHAGANIPSLNFEMSEFSARNIVDFISQLGELFDLPSNRARGRGGKIFRQICDSLCDEPLLLIFDQVEAVAPRVLQVIRQLWDHTRHAGVGIVLLGAPLLVERMRDTRMRDAGALASRVGIWTALRGISREEAADIIRQEGIGAIDDAAFTLLWRAAGGSMRRLMGVTDLLRAKHAGKAVTEKTLAGVAGHLWGIDWGKVA